MKKKVFTASAFTLIELLAVIIVIGLLIAIIAPVTYNLVNKTKENSYYKLVDIIESGARLYVSRHFEEINQIIEEEGILKVSLDELVADNLLEAPIIDPRNDEPILLSKQIWITKKDMNSEALIYYYEDRLGFVTYTIYGDVNGDGEIDVADANLILRYIVDLVDLKDWQKERADVNLDGLINVSDAILILRYITGLVPTLPVNKTT